MKDRIAKIIKDEVLTSQQFAEKIDIQPATISHILSGRNSPSLKIASGILKSFPHIDPDWLIFGTGEQNRTDNSKHINITDVDNIEKHEDVIVEGSEGINLFTDVNKDYLESEDDLIGKAETGEFTPLNSDVKGNIVSAIKDDIISNNSLNNEYSIDSPTIKLETNNSGNIKKIIFIYDDNSFEVCKPR